MSFSCEVVRDCMTPSAEELAQVQAVKMWAFVHLCVENKVGQAKPFGPSCVNGGA